MTGLALPRRRPGGEAGRLALELALFAALAGFGVAHWARLVDSPPLGRLLAALAVAAAGGLALALIGRASRRHATRVALAALTAVALIAAALVAAGLPSRLVLPGNWDELAAGIGDGLAGIEDTSLPYTGADEWLRRTLVLGAPALLALAAVLTFWPSRRPARARVLGLIALLALYGIAVTLDSPGSERLWGVPLLVLAVAWLWLPGAGVRRGGVVLAGALVAGCAALPIAAQLDSERPWLDYRGWDWFADEREVTYEWNHSYGPLDWPQRGTTLLGVSSPRPLYWRTSILDRFDGFTWQRADRSDPLALSEIVARSSGPSATELAVRHPQWVVETIFEVRALTSELVVAAGTPLAIEGAGPTVVDTDGTALAVGATLARGDVYAVEAYAPDPSRRRLRAAPQAYPQGQFAESVLVGLPATVASGGLPPETVPASGFAPAPATVVPSWGRPGGAARAAMLGSPYAGVYRLAKELTADAPTVFEAVRAVETHLRESYDYSHSVANQTYPLNAFLLEDGSGYCQHFAGSMALMLRMVGIPARVVAGFAPGTYDRERQRFEVSDTDAHSWVEVYFRGIGWVPFDPTPAAAPAASQLEAGGPLTLGLGNADDRRGGGIARSLERRLEGGAPAANEGDEGSSWAAVGLAILGLGFTTAAVRAWGRRRRLGSDAAGTARARELVAALERLGWELGPSVTLTAIERRFEGAGRSAIASYAAALRRHRFAPRAAGPPGPAQRRRLRTALARGGGLRRRLAALRAVPLGGPSARIG